MTRCFPYRRVPSPSHVPSSLSTIAFPRSPSLLLSRSLYALRSLAARSWCTSDSMSATLSGTLQSVDTHELSATCAHAATIAPYPSIGNCGRPTHVVSLSPWTDTIEGSSPEGYITGTMVFNARAAARPSIPRLTLGCPRYNSLAPLLCSPLSLVSHQGRITHPPPCWLACILLAC